jgi:lipopolysaccharide transport system permease protein
MASQVQEIVIEAGRVERRYWADLWRYRELFFSLAQRELLVRYKQTVVGVAWAVLRPLLTMAVLTVVFGRLAKLPSEGMPYPVLVLSALIPWMLFSTALTEGSNSLIGNANLISKTYFPRIIVPMSSVAVSAVDSLISLALLLCAMAVFRLPPSFKMLLLPVFLLLTCLPALGLTVLLAALNVRYRDFRYLVGFLVQFGMLISPIGFASSVVGQRWHLLYALNPLVGLIDGFRWCLGPPGQPFVGSSLVISLLISALSIAVGVRYFRATERTFADVI